MSENLLKIELYRILVSIAVGLITILVFIFNISVAERYYHNLSSYVQSAQTNNEARKYNSQDTKHTEDINQDELSNPNLTWQDLKSSIRRTLKLFNENIIAFLAVSIFLGEFISWIGMIFILGIYERRLDEGLYNRELYVDNDIKWKLSITLLKPMADEKLKFALGVSEVHFALAKAFSGISLSIYICLIWFSILIKEWLCFSVSSVILLILLMILLFKRIYFIRLINNIEKSVMCFFFTSFFLITVFLITVILLYAVEIIRILILVKVFTAFLSFLLSIYHMRFANQFMCLASEECYKKQNTIQDTTSQP